ncbi:NADP-dependent oxidoreductase domain-containing protein [Lyophyllum atratum]|nr:NADP-dependent oxidoreductase domain-containing protein [Lyophyllum atratum]
MAAIVLKRTGQKVTKSSCADTVYAAIKAGYRLLDGAGDYGNEKEAGEGVRRAIQDGIVKREELCEFYILWNTFHAHDHVKSITKKQLDLWGIDYFDLFLVHFPIALQYVDPAHRYPPEWFDDNGVVRLQNTHMQETWGAMEELVDEGHAKNIGLSNCSGSLILDVLRYARIEPQVLQVELHPYLTQSALIDLAKTLGIAITAYSSFGPQGYVELSMDKGAASLMSHDAVMKVSKKHDKTPAQVLLRWATQRGIAVVPKSNDAKRLQENLQCDSFDLGEEEIKSISALNIDLRLNNPAEIDPRLAIFA